MAIDIKEWLPQSPEKGPPLPAFLEIYWPWLETPPVPPTGVLGDLDYDGYVTEADVQLLMDYLASKIDLTPDQLKRAKVTPDEPPYVPEVSVGDALLIDQYVRGLIDTFPAGQPAPRKR